jgi:hypothetical protein
MLRTTMTAGASARLAGRIMLRPSTLPQPPAQSIPPNKSIPSGIVTYSANVCAHAYTRFFPAGALLAASSAAASVFFGFAFVPGSASLPLFATKKPRSSRSTQASSVGVFVVTHDGGVSAGASGPASASSDVASESSVVASASRAGGSLSGITSTSGSASDNGSASGPTSGRGTTASASSSSFGAPSTHRSGYLWQNVVVSMATQPVNVDRTNANEIGRRRMR